jgi:hypothetical protein
MIKILNKALLIFLSIAFLSSQVLAECKCGKFKSTDEAFKSSDVVFLGQVVTVTNSNILHPDYKVAKVAIVSPYKGVEILPATEYVTVFTKKDDCGVNFAALSDYLIFASGDPAFLTTSTCQLTDIQEKSKERLIRVDALSR